MRRATSRKHAGEVALIRTLKKQQHIQQQHGTTNWDTHHVANLPGNLASNKRRPVLHCEAAANCRTAVDVGQPSADWETLCQAKFTARHPTAPGVCPLQAWIVDERVQGVLGATSNKLRPIVPHATRGREAGSVDHGDRPTRRCGHKGADAEDGEYFPQQRSSRHWRTGGRTSHEFTDKGRMITYGLVDTGSEV